VRQDRAIGWRKRDPVDRAKLQRTEAPRREKCAGFERFEESSELVAEHSALRSAPVAALQQAQVAAVNERALDVERGNLCLQSGEYSRQIAFTHRVRIALRIERYQCTLSPPCCRTRC